jgi:hypothetical protein
MAVIVRNNVLNGNMWDEWATIINAAIMDADVQKNQYDDLVNALANVQTSKRWGEKSTTIGGLGDYSTKAEGADAAYDYFTEGYSKFIEHITFAKSVSISKEMVDDNQIAEMKSRAINLVQAYKRTRAKLQWSPSALRRLPWWLSSKESACQCRRHKRRVFDPWVRKMP